VFGGTRTIIALNGIWLDETYTLVELDVDGHDAADRHDSHN
jgi:hypothetical protein